MNKVKKIILLTIMFFLMCSCSAIAAEYTIEVNGNKLNADVKIIDGRTLVPLRSVGEALGLEVLYSKAGNNISLFLTNDNDEITNCALLYLDNAKVDIAIFGETNNALQETRKLLETTPKDSVNDDIFYKYLYFEQGFELEVPPINDNGCIYVPVRFVCNLFSAPLQVDGSIIKIGTIFTASERQDIEGLRKKSLLMDENKVDDHISSYKFLPIITQEVSALEYLEKVGNYLQNLIDSTTQSDLQAIKQGYKNEKQINNLVQSQIELLAAKNCIEDAIENCGDYTDLQKMKNSLIEINNELDKALAIDVNDVDYVNTCYELASLLQNMYNIFDNKISPEYDLILNRLK